MVQTALGFLALFQALWAAQVSEMHLLAIAFSIEGSIATRKLDAKKYTHIMIPSIYLAVTSMWKLLAFLLSFQLQGLLFVILKSVVSGIQVYAISKLWQSIMAEALVAEGFYLNFFVTNKDEVVKKMVEDKVGGMKKKIISKVANKLVSDDKFTKGFSTKMEQEVPEEMKNKGISAKCKAVFQKDNYFCLKVDIESVDLEQIMKTKGENQDKINTFHSIIDALNPFFRQMFDRISTIVVAQKLMSEMPLEMARKLKKKAGMEVEVVERCENDQASFFFQYLNGTSVKKILGIDDEESTKDSTSDGDDADEVHGDSDDDVDREDGNHEKKSVAHRNKMATECDEEDSTSSLNSPTQDSSEVDTKTEKWYPGKHLKKKIQQVRKAHSRPPKEE